MASEAILKQKEEEVKALAEKFKTANLILLTDYRGITVEDVTGLRNTLRLLGNAILWMIVSLLQMNIKNLTGQL